MDVFGDVDEFDIFHFALLLFIFISVLQMFVVDMSIFAILLCLMKDECQLFQSLGETEMNIPNFITEYFIPQPEL